MTHSILNNTICLLWHITSTLRAGYRYTYECTIFLSIFSPSLLSSCFGNHLMEMFLQLGLFLPHVHSSSRCPLDILNTQNNSKNGIILLVWVHKRLALAEIRTVDLIHDLSWSKLGWRLRPLDHCGSTVLLNFKYKQVHNPGLGQIKGLACMNKHEDFTQRQTQTKQTLAFSTTLYLILKDLIYYSGDPLNREWMQY